MFLKKTDRHEQRRIMKAIIDIHKVMDSIDDGYHNKEIVNLVKISNELYECLTEVNQKYVRLTLAEEFKRVHGIELE